jgi:hypothetical protein
MSDINPQPSVRTSITAIISLITGIIGLFSSVTGVGALFSIAAVVTGHISKSEIKKSMGTVGGNGLATGGLITGYIGLAIGLCICLLYVLVLAGAISLPFLTIPFINSTSSY